MSQKLIYIIIFALSFSIISKADNEDKKVLNTFKIKKAPNIDGVLDEDIWSKADTGRYFYMLNPGDGTPERQNTRSEVYVLYDDVAIYIGAKLYDSKPDEILKELGERDDFNKNTDIFLFSVNPYNDGQQVFNFGVSAAGVQLDEKYANGDTDVNWNAVWDSDVSISDEGWSVEMRIPYRELRFPEKDVQVWAVNFLRTVKRNNEEYTWNYINKSVGEYTQHYGELHGIENIEPPVRLSFMPYVSSYVDNYDKSTAFSYNLGMDLKYGINESFTLDATLIPDFGQAAYDEKILNLGPFEVRYDENRQFFTEGTELFNKGGLFYSRRIGGIPGKYGEAEDSLGENEEISENPLKTPIINAFKVSGRNKNGLGIGFFNAITNTASAKIIDSESGSEREFVTESLANYNVLVLDQRFSTNSSVSFVNTNVLRSGDFRDANVSAFLFDLANKSNSYKVGGDIKYSHIIPVADSVKSGYQGSVTFSKISGKFRFWQSTGVTSKYYDNTDLGFMMFTNIVEIDQEISYQTFEPDKYFNSYYVEFGVFHDRRFQDNHFIKLNLRLNSRFTTLNFFSFGGNITYSPYETYDYFEPRADNRYLVRPTRIESFVWGSTDYRKKFALDMVLGGGNLPDWDNKFLFVEISPRLRLNNRFFIEAEAERLLSLNEVGWVNELENGDIIMGVRDRRNLVSSLGASYTFNEKMTLKLNFRHYWADIEYSDFKTLESDGYLGESGYSENHNTTFNTWNIDLNYSWWFAPGSQLSILYRNSLLSSFEESGFDYLQNIDRLFNEPMQNVFSVRLMYFIDYNNVRNLL